MNYMMLERQQMMYIDHFHAISSANGLDTQYLCVFSDLETEKVDYKVINFDTRLKSKKDILNTTEFRVDLVFEDQVLTSLSFRIAKIKQSGLVRPSISQLRKIGLPIPSENYDKLNEYISKMSEVIKKLIDLTSKEKYCLFNVDLSPLESLLEDELENRALKLKNLILGIKDKINNYFCHALFVLDNYSRIVETEVIRKINLGKGHSIKSEDDYNNTLTEIIACSFLNSIYKRKSNINFIKLIREEHRKLLKKLLEDYPKGRETERIKNYSEEWILDLEDAFVVLPKKARKPRYYYDIHNKDNPNGSCRCAFVLSVSEGFLKDKLIGVPIEKDTNIILAEAESYYFLIKSIISKGNIISSIGREINWDKIYQEEGVYIDKKKLKTMKRLQSTILEENKIVDMLFFID